MGRVRAKRKLKQCDPFFKGTRDNGKAATAYDLPPTPSKRAKKRGRKMLRDEATSRFVLRTSAVDTQQQQQQQQQTLQVDSIRDGESMRAFNKRISTEVRRVIGDAHKRSRRSSEKRRAFLAAKKAKARDKKMTAQERYAREYQTSGSTQKDFFEDAAPARFGERVDAPPILPKLAGIFKTRAEQLGRDRAKAAKKAAAVAVVGGRARK